MGYINLACERIGIVNKNKYGSLMEIIEYKNANDIKVKFIEYGNIEHAGYSDFCKGKVKNPYDKTIYNVGYIGEGEYVVSINGKSTKQYNTWRSMLERCYSELEQNRHPSYKGCSVAMEWHNFQNFAAWYDENYYEVDGEKMNLDKDILIKGNKIYSPETCIFAPRRINILFIKNNSLRGNLPIGVSYNKEHKMYGVKYGINNKKYKHLGYYDNPEDAFNSYKIHKEKLIKQVAEEYKDKIPTNLYEAMINYRVEITD